MKIRLLYICFTFISFGLFAQKDLAWMRPNMGQWDKHIKFKVDLSAGEMYVENQGFTYLFHNAHEVYHKAHEHDKNNADAKLKFHVIRSQFLGSNENAMKTTAIESEFYQNYFIDSDVSKWQSKVHAVAEVRYKDFYPNIDLILESKKDEFKYSLIVSPNANPSVIVSEILGADFIELLASGSLRIKHSFGEIQESKPLAWTIDENGRKHRVDINFVLHGNKVGYEFPNGYNKNHQLIIDPSLTFSSYTGSTGDNWGNTATPDEQTNLFAGGIVFAPGYPTSTGAFDPFYSGGTSSGFGISGFDMGISKFSADGTQLLFSTYLGGSNGNETPMSLITDKTGDLYILGTSSSSNFPMSGNSFQPNFSGGSFVTTPSSLDYQGTDIVVIKMAASGSSLLASTFLGGSGNDGLNIGDLDISTDLVHNYGDNFRGEIILDKNGNVLIASTTTSSNFPVFQPNQSFGGKQDAVFVKLKPDLSDLIWSTYFGGSEMEAGYSIQESVTGDIYVTGGTSSPGIDMPGGVNPSFLGNIDGFLLRLNSNTAQIKNGTYVGTSAYDQSYFVQIDLNNDIYIYGQSEGAMAVTPGLFGNASAGQFIRKYKPDLSSILWTTKVGGPSNNNTAISPTAFLVSNCEEIYFAGWGGNILGSNIGNFPTTADAYQNSSSDGDAFYIAVLESNASSLKYATFFGGNAREHVDGGTSRFDKSGRIYHAVCSACGGQSNGFVSTPGAFSTTNNSDNCNLAAFKFELNTIKSIVTEPNYVICAPDNVTFSNSSVEGDEYMWYFGDNTTSTEKFPTHLYTDPGIYTVKLVVSDSKKCKYPDSTTFNIEIGDFKPGTVVAPPTICKKIPYQLEASGGLYYKWTPSDVLDDATIPNPIAIIDKTTTFKVIISDSCGKDSVNVTLQVYDDEIQVSNDTSICIGQFVTLSVSGAISQIWTPNQFISNNTVPMPNVSPTQTQYYYLEATTLNGCVFNDSIEIQVFFEPPTNNLSDSIQICLYSEALLIGSGATDYIWSPNIFIHPNNKDSVYVSPPNDQIYYCVFINPCGSMLDSVFIDVIIPHIEASNDLILCLGDSAMLIASGAINYAWTPVSYLNTVTNDTVISKPQHSMDYLVIGQDSLGCKDSANVHIELYPIYSVNLGEDIIAEIGDHVNLFAQTDVGGSFLWTPPNYLSCSSCQNTIANPDFNMNYNVVFTDRNGCKTSDNINIIYKGIIYVPNTFTPNGNQFNEVFKAYGSGILSFEMLVFNRWGEIVSDLKSVDESWDGNYKGNKCQDGTYTWKITYKDITQEEKKLVGHVNLIR